MTKKLEVDPKAQALIFDVDGTLVDSMTMHYNAWVRILNHYGIDFPKERFMALSGKSVRQIIDVVSIENNIPLDPEAIISQKNKEFLEIIHQLKPIDPVVELVKNYFGKIPMAAGTGGQRRIVEMELEITGLSQYFPILITSEDVKNHKPSPDTFLKCADLLGIDPQFCQVFEDSKLGIEAGINAGMITTDVTPYYNT
jgi:beta-phosphoglucomutase-like phosphatase (HAD superfamily)